MSHSENQSSPDHQDGDLEEGANPARNVGSAGDENSPELGPERNGEVAVDIPEIEEGANPARSNTTPNVGSAGDENSPEPDAERNGEVAVNIREILQGTEVENGTQVRPAVPRQNDRHFPPYKLIKMVLTLIFQLAGVYVGNILNKSPPPCSCSCLPSSSDSKSSDNNSAADIVAWTILGGFVVTLISMPTTKMRATISSPIAKVGFTAAAFVVILSVGLTLPLDAKWKIGVIVAACIPALAAIACA